MTIYVEKGGHRAIGIKPEQYLVVGKKLLQVVKDVLGDNATDEIIEAWGKTYEDIYQTLLLVWRINFMKKQRNTRIFVTTTYLKHLVKITIASRLCLQLILFQ